MALWIVLALIVAALSVLGFRLAILLRAAGTFLASARDLQVRIEPRLRAVLEEGGRLAVRAQARQKR